MSDKTWTEITFSWGFVEWMILSAIFFWLWFKLAKLIPQEKVENWLNKYFGKLGGPILFIAFVLTVFIVFFVSYIVVLNYLT